MSSRRETSITLLQVAASRDEEVGGSTAASFDLSGFECIDVKDVARPTAAASSSSTLLRPADPFCTKDRAQWMASKMPDEENALVAQATEALRRSYATDSNGSLLPDDDDEMFFGSGHEKLALATPDRVGKNDELFSVEQVIADVPARFAGSSLSVEAQGECRDSLAEILRQYASPGR